MSCLRRSGLRIEWAEDTNETVSIYRVFAIQGEGNAQEEASRAVSICRVVATGSIGKRRPKRMAQCCSGRQNGVDRNGKTGLKCRVLQAYAACTVLGTETPFKCRQIGFELRIQ